jgi:hypothetical protein
MLTEVVLGPGHYVLTFPSRKEKIRARWVPNREFQPPVVRMTIANIARVAPPQTDHPIEPKPGEGFHIKYQAIGEAEAVPVQVDSDTSVIVSINSDKLFSNPAIS